MFVKVYNEDALCLEFEKLQVTYCSPRDPEKLYHNANTQNNVYYFLVGQNYWIYCTGRVDWSVLKMLQDLNDIDSDSQIFIKNYNFINVEA